jgi:hypothetical protein
MCIYQHECASEQAVLGTCTSAADTQHTLLPAVGRLQLLLLH